MNSEYLSPFELHGLTGYSVRPKQIEWLKAAGIPHRVDGGRVIVSRVHVQAWIEGRTVVSGGINFGAVA